MTGLRWAYAAAVVAVFAAGALVGAAASPRPPGYVMAAVLAEIAAATVVAVAVRRLRRGGARVRRG